MTCMRQGIATVALLLAFTPPAIAGAGLRFDGVDDHVRIPHQPLLSIADGMPFTIELWVNPSAAGGSHLLGKRSTCFDSGQSSNYQLYSVPGVSLELNSGACVTLGSGVPSGVWSHIAVVADASGTRIYTDGQLAGESACTIGGANTADLWLGSSTQCPAPYPGDLDEVRLWNVALTQAQIQAGRTQVIAANSPGLVAYWRFEEPAGSQVVLDATLNMLDGTLGSDADPGGDDPLRVASAAPNPDLVFANGFE